MFDPKAMGELVVKTVKEYCGRVVADVADRVDALTKRIDDLPVPKDGKDADPAEIEKAVDAAVQKAIESLPKPAEIDAKAITDDVLVKVAKLLVELPAPKAPKELDPAELKSLVDSSIERAIAARPVPVPKDGKDADAEAITKDVMGRLASVLDSIPVPKDGKDVDPAVVREMVTTEVAHAVEALPKPQDGKSIDTVELAGEIVKAAKLLVPDVEPLVDRAVQRAVEALPKPAALEFIAGQAAPDAAAVLATIKEVVATELAAAIRELPKPKDGASVDLDEVVAAVVKKIHAPKDGLDADPKAVADLVAEQVAQAVAKLPPAKHGNDGKTLTVDDIREVLVSEVRAAVAELPKPLDGKDADPATVAEMVAKAVESIPKPRDGRDADPEAVAGLVRAAVDELAKSLPAPKDGKDADPAAIQQAVAKAVAEIPRPKDGESVHIDTVRVMLSELVEKAVAALPKPQDGRDATELEILPAIDFERRYARRTWARHDGGLWHAFRDTDGADGWECITAGVSAIDVTQADDLRTFVVSTTLTGGAKTEKSFSVPVVIERGTFDRERTYERGDAVTWAGSFWIAQKDGLIGVEPRGIETGWRLSVKQGRPGKDGVAIEPIDPNKQVKL